MGGSFVIEARDQRFEVGIGRDLGRVDVEFPTPDQSRLLAQIHDLLEEALEDGDSQPLPDAGQAGVVGQLLVQGVAEVPAVRQIEGGGFDQLALGADALEEQDELQLEEDHRVDTGPAPLGIQFPHPVPHEAQVELCLEMTVEVARRNNFLKRDGNRCIKVTGLGRAEHGTLQGM